MRAPVHRYVYVNRSGGGGGGEAGDVVVKVNKHPTLNDCQSMHWRHLVFCLTQMLVLGRLP
jgi:hypothetical protein